ncbi:MAG: hypothetical protein EAZ92_02375 [Candidatus Kapaibacterium sp.]|nr:MAG: hypothetical protein EAZ92_02375 [Candidatus Kapabacteria bacterium]
MHCKKQYPEDPIDTIVCSEATDTNAIAEDLHEVIAEFESFRTCREREPTQTSDKFLLTVNAKQGNINISGYYTEEANYGGRKFSIMFELPNLLKAAQNQASESGISSNQFFEEVVRKALPELVELAIGMDENQAFEQEYYKEGGDRFVFFDTLFIYYRFDAAAKPEQLFSSLHDGTHAKKGIFYELEKRTP